MQTSTLPGIEEETKLQISKWASHADVYRSDRMERKISKIDEEKEENTTTEKGTTQTEREIK